MATVQEIVDALSLEVAAGRERLDRPVTGGYASDLLSCVMAKAQPGNVWITLQAHMNVVAVAALLDLACVIVTEGAQPSPEMLDKADERGIALLLSAASTFEVVGALARLGIGQGAC
ncbi:MAG: serine kinase [Chloroflexi bacterium]|nr:serine kinase [Chloroflexota bacterium]